MSRRNEQRRYALVFPSGYFEPFARFQKRTNFSEKPVFTQVKNADEECNAAGKASLIVAFVPRGGSEANQRCCGDVSKPGVRPGSIVASRRQCRFLRYGNGLRFRASLENACRAREHRLGEFAWSG